MRHLQYLHYKLKCKPRDIDYEINLKKSSFTNFKVTQIKINYRFIFIIKHKLYLAFVNSESHEGKVDYCNMSGLTA